FAENQTEAQLHPIGVHRKQFRDSRRYARFQLSVWLSNPTTSAMILSSLEEMPCPRQKSNAPITETARFGRSYRIAMANSMAQFVLGTRTVRWPWRNRMLKGACTVSVGSGPKMASCLALTRWCRVVVFG